MCIAVLRVGSILGDRVRGLTMRRVFTAAVFFCASLIGSAHAAVFDIGWTGTDNVTISGSFSFDDSLLGTGPIDGSDIDTLSYSVFDNVTEIFTFDLADAGPGFNFNFDATTQQFLVGGLSDGANGQQWFDGDDNGFISGNAGQLYTQSVPFIAFFGFVNLPPSTLVATPVSQVPVPAALPLLATALAALGFLNRRKRKTA